MSDLSELERTAGISRQALAIIRKKAKSEGRRMRGQINTTHISAGENGAGSASYSRTETFTEISNTKMTSVVCTPYRTVELLEGPDEMFALRETSWSGRQVSCSHIWFKPFELQKFKDVLNRITLLDEVQKNSNGKPAKSE